MRDKNKSIMRLVVIGLFHATVFLWLLPDVIIPLAGGRGLTLGPVIVIGLTIIITTLIMLYPTLRRYWKKK